MPALQPIYAPAASVWRAKGAHTSVTSAYTLGSTVAAATFVAPVGGQVLVQIEADLRPGPNVSFLISGWRVREGSVPGAGTIVASSTEVGSPEFDVGRVFSVTNASTQSASSLTPVTGLTAGATYTAEHVIRFSGGTGVGASVPNEVILVIPVFW